MAFTPESLLAWLDALGIAHATHRHPPLFTVEDSKALRGQLPGGHCKNLFLKDKKDRLWLVVALEDTAIDLKALAKRLDAGRFTFGKPELLQEVLGVTPGSVTPFALANDAGRRVSVVLDAAMLACDPLNYHPLTNEATTTIAAADLRRFLDATGHVPHVLELAATAPA